MPARERTVNPEANVVCTSTTASAASARRPSKHGKYRGRAGAVSRRRRRRPRATRCRLVRIVERLGCRVGGGVDTSRTGAPSLSPGASGAASAPDRTRGVRRASGGAAPPLARRRWEARAPSTAALPGLETPGCRPGPAAGGGPRPPARHRVAAPALCGRAPATRRRLARDPTGGRPGHAARRPRRRHRAAPPPARPARSPSRSGWASRTRR